LFCSNVLHHISHFTLARFTKDGHTRTVLWPDCGVHEKVIILYSDAMAYILKAVTVLKGFCTNLVHFTCLAQGAQCVAKEVTAKSPKVNKLISIFFFLKAPLRMQSYKQHCQMHPCPPPPRTSANKLGNLDPNNQLLEWTLRNCEISCIQVSIWDCLYASNFVWLPQSEKRLETEGLPLKESMGTMKNSREKLSAVK
jgi:hypothetical protein